MAKEYWLKCNRIEPGMFPNERTIYIIDVNGEMFSCFLNERQIDQENNLSKVHIFSVDNEYVLVGNSSWMSAGFTVIKVSKSQIVEKEVQDDDNTDWFKRVREKVNWFVIDDLNKKGK